MSFTFYTYGNILSLCMSSDSVEWQSFLEYAKFSNFSAECWKGIKLKFRMIEKKNTITTNKKNITYYLNL